MPCSGPDHGATASVLIQMVHLFKVGLYLILLALIGYWLQRVRSYYGLLGYSPLEKYGVSIERIFGRASSAFPYLSIRATHKGSTYECPFPIGGMEYPRIRFHDVDGDGIEDIDFGNDKRHQIIAVKPSKGDNPPKFLLLRDDVNSWDVNGNPRVKTGPL